MTENPTPIQPAQPRTSHPFAWQGWRLVLPVKWNPVKLDGGYDAGSVIFADLHRIRLGMRWKKMGGRSYKPEKWTQAMLSESIGKLAAAEARPIELRHAEFHAAMLYTEPSPPGRDVFVAYSPVSGRMIELAYHTRRREHALASVVCPTLLDQSPERAMRWSVFDLSCIVPEGMRLESHTLNAGDLSLTFADGKRRITVRQVAVAELALKRMPIEKWLADQEKTLAGQYAARGRPEATEYRVDGRILRGVARTLRRRLRYFWQRSLTPQWQTMALHDVKRDRLILLQATDGELAEQVLRSIGWAADYVPVEVHIPRD
jgi:hypothetical protein